MRKAEEMNISNYPTEKAEEMWLLACCGETEKLEAIIDEEIPGYDANTRVKGFAGNGKISLIMGAYRNRNLDTVEMLIAEGGTVEEHEKEEIEPFINRRRIDIMEKMIYTLVKPAENSEAEKFKAECLEEYTEKLNRYTAIIK